MSAAQHEFSMMIDVQDVDALLAAARAHPDAEGVDESDFYDEPGRVNISTCLRILLDPGSLPGCEIIDSVVEAAS